MTLRHNVLIIDNISSDIFTFVSGIPITSDTHATDMANCMIELVKSVGKIQIAESPDVKFSLRVGLHTGIHPKSNIIILVISEVPILSKF